MGGWSSGVMKGRSSMKSRSSMKGRSSGWDFNPVLWPSGPLVLWSSDVGAGVADRQVGKQGVGLDANLSELN